MSDQKTRPQKVVVTEGYHMAFITNYGLYERNGSVSAFIELTGEMRPLNAMVDKNVTLTWWGSLKSEKSAQYCLSVLKRIGYASDNLLDLMKGRAANLLPVNHKVQIVVENEVNRQTGELLSKVKYINLKPRGGSQFDENILKNYSWLANIKPLPEITNQTIGRPTKEESARIEASKSESLPEFDDIPF
jgi:hypothetical protein